MAGSLFSLRSYWSTCLLSVTRTGMKEARCLARLRAMLPALVLCAGGLATSAYGQTVQTIKTAAPVESIVESGTGAFILAGGQFFATVDCDSGSGLCLEPLARPSGLAPAPTDALPDGRIAIAGTGDIRQAWFARPTTRYTHGVLGDAIEGGSLVVVTFSGNRHEIVLPVDQVFEDITPRIADLDGDGTNEIIAIRSSKNGGAAAVIFGLVDNALTLRGAGTENGRPNRWLNIAGIVPHPDGGLTLYGVRTPHIGGRLFSLDFRNGTLSESNDIATDVSNHIIGSRVLGMSATGKFAGRMELVLPSQDRMRLRFPLTGRPDIPLPAAIDKAIIVVDGRVITATEDGTLIIVSP